MPNVMGREFPYTPQGMAAAEQYKQAMGMRDGGMMGFRPLQMQGGGTVTDLMAIVRELTDLEQNPEVTTEQVKDFVIKNKNGLLEAAEKNPEFAAYLQRMITRFAPQQTPDAILNDPPSPPPETMPSPEMRMPSPEQGEQFLMPRPEMAPRPEMRMPPEQGEQFLMPQTEIPGSSGVSQPFRGGGIASLRRY